MINKKKNRSFKISGTNLRRAKSHNHSVVLEVIRTRGPISRTEISRVTLLSRQTIQNIVGQLEKHDLVRMKVSKSVGRGHPGTEVSLNPDAALNFGFHVDRTQTTAVVCNLEGRQYWSDTRALPVATIDAAIETICKSVADFRRSHPELNKKIIGCGVAAPGPFSVDVVAREDPASFQELGTPESLSALEQRLGLPVVLENDATTAAIGEHVYGAGRDSDNFACLQFGIGIGAGFVLGGVPYSGSSGNAGEIGHTIIVPGGEPCPCGKKGCLERYLSIDSLCRHLGLSPDHKETVDRISELIAGHDARVGEWVSSAVPRFHQAISIIEAMADPEVIVVGGTAPSCFIDLMIESAMPFPASHWSPPHPERIRRGAAGQLSIALGASAVSVSAHFIPSVSGLVL